MVLLGWLFGIIVAIVVIAVGVAFLNRFYRKSTRDTALVRTGFGGQKIVLSGGCLALPFLHRVEEINMRTIRVEVRRTGDKSLITADRIRVDEAEVMIAGGAESMSLVPMTGNKPSFNPEMFVHDENVGIAYGMGMTAEKVAAQWKVSREAQDAFALQSHQRALAAIAAGEFKDEITPVTVTERSPDLASGGVKVKTRTVDIDEGPRPDTSLEGLAKLKPAFAAKGSVTAGNSSQTSDGAGALIVCSEKALRTFNLAPLARFVGFAARGVAPEVMGIGPIEAIPAALKLAGIAQDDLGWIELNEAFAAQSLAVIDTCKLDPAKVNPMGGAIALGHPLGATGAIRSATVVHALRRHNLKYGMVTMCVGMGQGAAGILERC